MKIKYAESANNAVFTVDGGRPASETQVETVKRESSESAAADSPERNSSRAPECDPVLSAAATAPDRTEEFLKSAALARCEACGEYLVAGSKRCDHCGRRRRISAEERMRAPRKEVGPVLLDNFLYRWARRKAFELDDRWFNPNGSGDPRYQPATNLLFAPNLALWLFLAAIVVGFFQSDPDARATTQAIAISIFFGGCAAGVVCAIPHAAVFPSWQKRTAYCAFAALAAFLFMLSSVWAFTIIFAFRFAKFMLKLLLENAADAKVQGPSEEEKLCEAMARFGGTRHVEARDASGNSVTLTKEWNSDVWRDSCGNAYKETDGVFQKK